MSRLASLCGALALSLSASLASAEPVSAKRAIAALSACTEDTETSWAERVPGGWLAVCGDAWGRRVAVLDVAKVERAARCEAKAELDYRLAELVGVEPDSAWEDSYAACVGAP